MGILESYTDRIILYVKNAGWYFSSSMFVAIVGLAMNPLLAMNLDPLDYAIVGYFSSYNLLLLPLITLNIDKFYSRQYFFIPEGKRIDLEHTIVSTLLVIGSCALVLFLAGFYVFYSITEHSFPFWPYALLAFVQIYLNIIAGLYLSKLKITRQAKKFAIINIGQCLLTQGALILFVVMLHKGALGKLLAPLIISFLFAVYSCVKLLHKKHFDRQIMKTALKFGYPLAFAALFWYFLSGVDKFFLEKLNDSYTFGLYNVGASIALYLQIFYSSVSTTFAPDMYKSIAERNTRKLLKIVSVILATVVISNLLFVAFAPLIIDLLTAGRYTDSCLYARIFAIQNITMALYLLTGSIIEGYGYVKQQLVLRICAAAVALFIYKYMIDSFGFVGAAWGQVLSFLFAFVITAAFLIIKARKSGPETFELKK